MTQKLADGTYRWNAVTHWADQPMQATVKDGVLTEYNFVNADGSTTPAYDVAAFQNLLREDLIAEIKRRARLGGLVPLVEFIPAASEMDGAA